MLVLIISLLWLLFLSEYVLHAIMMFMVLSSSFYSFTVFFTLLANVNSSNQICDMKRDILFKTLYLF